MTTEITIKSTDGLALEAALDGPESPFASLVLCHPHPQMGGTMNAPLLLAIRDEMVERGWAVLRFNFRGIGRSEGTPGTGIDEVADATGALDYVIDTFPHRHRTIAGWSFGAAVALRLVAEDPRVRGCVAIAPPVEAKPGVTAGVPRPRDFRYTTPILMVIADNDKQVSPEACLEWALDMGAQIAQFPGANHFFWAKYDELAGVVGSWLHDRVWGAR